PLHLREPFDRDPPGLADAGQRAVAPQRAADEAKDHDTHRHVERRSWLSVRHSRILSPTAGPRAPAALIVSSCAPAPAGLCRRGRSRASGAAGRWRQAPSSPFAARARILTPWRDRRLSGTPWFPPRASEHGSGWPRPAASPARPDRGTAPGPSGPPSADRPPG